MFKKLKDKKGFTLVELIVVLVILAILAALLIPALTGYIDKANKEKVTAECRMAVMAIQTEATTIYGENGQVTKDLMDAAKDDIRDLAEVSGHWTAKFTTSGEVQEVKYNNGSWTATYKAATESAAAAYSNVKKDTATVNDDTYTLVTDTTGGAGTGGTGAGE